MVFGSFKKKVEISKKCEAHAALWGGGHVRNKLFEELLCLDIFQEEGVGVA